MDGCAGSRLTAPPPPQPLMFVSPPSLLCLHLSVSLSTSAAGGTAPSAPDLTLYADLYDGRTDNSMNRSQGKRQLILLITLICPFIKTAN